MFTSALMDEMCGKGGALRHLPSVACLTEVNELNREEPKKRNRTIGVSQPEAE